MATIQSFLMKKPNSAGLFPIAIRITKNRRSSYVFTGQYIEVKFWDEKYKRVKKSHPNSKRLNNLIAKKIADANDSVLESENQDDSQSAKKIKKNRKKKVKLLL